MPDSLSSQAPAEPFSDELLAQLVVSTGLLTPEQLASARQRAAMGDGEGGIPYRYAFAPDPFANGLLAYDPATMAVAERLLLDEPPIPPDLANWPTYSTGDVLILGPQEPTVLGAVSVGASKVHGLIPTPRGAFLYLGVPPQSADSPRLTTLAAPVMAPTASKTHPLDLAVSAGGEFLLVVNRGAGTVHVVVVNTCQQAGAIMLRAAGSTRGMGVAVGRREAYLTDGLTPRLTVLDVVSLKVRHQPFPTGPLGPVALTPDGSHLLIVFYKAQDELGLLTVTTSDLRVRHLMNLPGQRLPAGPGESITVTPDGNLAYVLAGDETGKPRLHAIDLAKKKPVAEIPLFGLPLAISFPPPPDWLPPRPSLEETIIRMGLATRDELRRMQLPPEGEVGPLMDPGLNPLILAQLPERLIRSMGMVPMMRDSTHLSVAMVNPRDAACQQLALQLAGGLQLRIIGIEQEDLETFMTERYPALMASYQAMKNATPVTRGPESPQPGPPQPGPPAPGARPGPPQPAAGGPPIPTPAAPRPPAPSPGPATPMAVPIPTPAPTRPPAAAPDPQPVRAAEPAPPPPLPSRPVQAPVPAVATRAPSVETLLSTNGRRVLLTENLKRQVREIDRERRDTWVMKDMVAGSAVYLPSGRVLLSDFGTNRVIEVDPLTSQTMWSFGDPGDRQKALRGPRWAGRLANGNTLVLDTGNHRVIEVDSSGQIVWSHGELGRAGCAGHSLFKPHGAFRTAEGTTLIADTG